MQRPSAEEVAAKRLENPLVYRAVLHIEDAAPDEVFAGARARFAAWLESKNLTAPYTSGIHRLTENYTATVANLFAENGHPSAIRLRLREDKASSGGGTWQTTLTAAVRHEGRRALIGIELEHLPNPNGQVPRAAPPRLIGELLDTFTVTDGDMTVTPGPRQAETDQVTAVVEALTDPDRRLPLLLAVEPFNDREDWQRFVHGVARQVVGTAVIVQFRPEAAEPLRARLGDGHRVGRGSIRTFKPGVDLSNAGDALRHRVLSYGRLRQSGFGPSAKKKLSRLPRLQAIHTPLPPLLTDAAFDTGDSAALDTDEAKKVITVLERKNQAMEQQIRELTDSRDDEIADHDATQAELSTAKRHIAALQQRLKEARLFGDAHAVPDGASAPISFEELNERAPAELPALVFTHAADRATDLDYDLKAGTWSSKAWDALLALNSYCELKRGDGFAGDFRRFCSSPPDGSNVYPVTQVAMGESDTVRNDSRMSAERFFDVPVEVDESGRLFMGAHIKLGSKGGMAPRIYFHDDTAGPTGAVIVGYIGRHLTNTRS